MKITATYSLDDVFWTVWKGENFNLIFLNNLWQSRVLEMDLQQLGTKPDYNILHFIRFWIFLVWKLQEQSQMMPQHFNVFKQLKQGNQAVCWNRKIFSSRVPKLSLKLWFFPDFLIWFHWFTRSQNNVATNILCLFLELNLYCGYKRNQF